MSGNYTKSKIKQYIRRMMSEIVSLNAKFDLWKHMQSLKSERLDDLNFAPAFFTLTSQSLVNDVIITLSKIYEHGKDTHNLNKFINIAKDNWGLFDYKDDVVNCSINIRLLDEYIQKIDDTKPILEKLFTWRDRAFAHNDKKYFFDRSQLVIDADLNISEIEELIRLAWRILNDCSLALEGTPWLLDSPDTTDVSKVIEAISFFRQTKREEIYELKKVLLAGAGLSTSASEDD